jgi:hypothetical protein
LILAGDLVAPRELARWRAVDYNRATNVAAVRSAVASRPSSPRAQRPALTIILALVAVIAAFGIGYLVGRGRAAPKLAAAPAGRNGQHRPNRYLPPAGDVATSETP